MTLVEGRAGDRIATDTHATLAGVGLRAEVAIVAGATVSFDGIGGTAWIRERREGDKLTGFLRDSSG